MNAFRIMIAAVLMMTASPSAQWLGYPTPGSFGSWAGVDRQLPTITLELPSDAAGPVAWRENREALLSAIQSK